MCKFEENWVIFVLFFTYTKGLINKGRSWKEIDEQGYVTTAHECESQGSMFIKKQQEDLLPAREKEIHTKLNTRT